MWSNGRDSANNLDCYNEYLLLTFQEHGHYLVLFTHVYATWPKPPQVVSVTNHLLCNGGYYMCFNSDFIVNLQ
jgi:hypothetical protein